jgi:hypothetical protein
MGELEDKINAVLSDPQQMAEISRLAQSLMGTGQTDAQPETATPAETAAKALPDLGSLLGGLSGGGSAAPGTDNQALLAAMLPYLSPHRQEKLRAAMRLGKMAKLAGFALKSHGGL